jgi:multidrug efflux pump subunit AcrB
MSNEQADHKGAIAWMARNSVASNLFMFILLFAGAIGLLRTKQEVLPEFDIDIILVNVAYPGASPAEVEQGIILVLEESVRSVEGIKRVKSNAAENSGYLLIELLFDADKDKVLSNVKSAVDRISTFPKDAEQPQISELSLRREVIGLIISGDQELSTLQNIAEKARMELQKDPNITQVEVTGIPAKEMSIEIPRATLEAHKLTLDDVAMQIKAGSLELPGGRIKTKGGELLVRVADRKTSVAEFSNLIITSSFDGAQVKLGSIATIVDGYADSDQSAYYNGKPAVRLIVFRIGEQTPIEVASAVKNYAEELQAQLPDSVEVSIWGDQSELLAGRIKLLMDNAKIGLLLVFGILAVFLEFRLAFWVALGIPISFLGSFILLGNSDATINMISLFAYIVTLGMVVDDAIVVGENIYEEHEKGKPWLEAAIVGAKQMIVPVTFAILTSIAAFTPLLLVPGVSGKFFRLIPLVVISVLILSLIESFFVLPAHLAHMNNKKPGFFRKAMEIPRMFVAKHLRRFIEGPFDTVLRLCIRARYTSFAIAIAMFFISIGFVGGGVVPFTFFPKIEGEKVTASVKLPYGSPVENTIKVQREMEAAAKRAIQELGGQDGLVRGMFSTAGEGPMSREGTPKGSHLATVTVNLVPSEQRDIGTEYFADVWQNNMPQMPGVEALKFASNLDGPGAGAAVDVQLICEDMDVLSEASAEVANILRSYSSLRGIENSYSSGKQQLNFKLREEARTLGLTSSDVARQLRSSFYGAEALREQIGRFERRTMVRLSKQERETEGELSLLRIKTPSGGYVPLEQVVDFSRDKSPTSISRESGVRGVNVRADLAQGVKSSREVITDLEKNIFPSLKEKYDGLEIELAGEQREQGETMASLGQNYLLALFAIYTLLAIPFKSYVQPFIIMSAIPFGFVGAVGGHMLMGFPLSIISMFGIVALTGVVVNDSLVLIDSANTYRREGNDAFNAIVMGAKRRLRPILLTSFTTFLGLAPMITEQSVQARFLIPMAISLGFGVLFATFVILLIVPALYMIIEDIIKFMDRFTSSSEEVVLVDSSEEGA